MLSFYVVSVSILIIALSLIIILVVLDSTDLGRLFKEMLILKIDEKIERKKEKQND